ncbi:hypothetical protein Hoch_6228 [Haliangium ochraceum DSM 14365]|uniref:Uncharacterized protein n=1 Tax=Haliangium ochraceum (strain DSM 14365 / JCM 11303 / SMP-2) TaxID=502025 RepID=D0LML5_HALO1|nr:hypothetical protein Hoch_6228 [Haliangium ochraceum DSM 14365]
MTSDICRCANCGAPLESDAGDGVRVSCRYCGAENVLSRALFGDDAAVKAKRMQLAAGEASVIAKQNEARAQALMEEFQQLSIAAYQGDRDAAERAVVAMEGYLRLQYAPTIHVYNSYDPSDPTVVAAMKQIDEAVAEALRATRESLGLSAE